MLWRQQTCLVALLLMAGIWVFTVGYYLGAKTTSYETPLYAKHASGRTLQQIGDRNRAKLYESASLTAKDIDDVETFLFFIGYPRSSHSILASMIDAHPNAIVAHEYNVFPQLLKHRNLLTNRTVLYNALYRSSCKELAHGWRSMDQSFASKGYGLKLDSPQSWQGRFRQLRVIGDKSGGVTVRMYRDHQLEFTEIYQQLSRHVRVPLKVIHMVRNPYDMMATRLLYRLSRQKRQKANYTSSHPVDTPGNVTQAMKALYTEAVAISDMSKQLNLTVLEVHNADFVRNPHHEMKRVCQFLGLECSSEYLEMVAKSTFPKLSVTRHSVVWREQAHKFIKSNILPFPFFRQYSFDSSQ